MNKREENGLSENKRLKSEDLAKLSLSATVKIDRIFKQIYIYPLAYVIGLAVVK